MDISAVLTVAAEAASAAGLVTVSTGAAEWLRERARLRRQADVARELLGLHQGELVAYRHDSKHVLYSGKQSLHPDNLQGLVAASGNSFRRAEDAGLVRVQDNIRVHASHDLALIGSPTAEGLSRMVFGYTSDGDADSLSVSNAPVDLPFAWVISKNEVDERAVAKRLVPGRGIVERPNWRIAGPKGLYVPRVDPEGLLADDFLLVTRVRNYITRAATDEGRFIVSFGGAHGTGTRALELLFEDRDVLREVAQQLRSRPAAFQMLFRVFDLLHDPAKGTHARRIELVEDVRVLPDNDRVWGTANQTLQRSTNE